MLQRTDMTPNRKSPRESAKRSGADQAHIVRGGDRRVASEGLSGAASILSRPRRAPPTALNLLLFRRQGALYLAVLEEAYRSIRR